MTGINGLTVEQEAFASHVGGAFVHACPGAGKTRTIIARLIKIAATLPPRRGGTLFHELCRRRVSGTLPGSSA